MIYLSVALAGILVEDRRPPPSLWQEPLFSNRLLEYEVWVRLNARNLYGSHGKLARALINRITFLELNAAMDCMAAPKVLVRRAATRMRLSMEPIQMKPCSGEPQ